MVVQVCPYVRYIKGTGFWCYLPKYHAMHVEHIYEQSLLRHYCVLAFVSSLVHFCGLNVPGAIP